MKDQNFTAAILVNGTPKEAFDAVNNVRGWWSEEIQGKTAKIGDTFKFHYKDLHYSTHKITESVPGKRVVWDTVEGKINFVKDKTEWDGTKIVFEITPKGDKTQVRFTHVGLVPSIECYGQCADAWSFYMKDSLRDLITKGKGEPNKKEKAK